jgi:hypothetical protein
LLARVERARLDGKSVEVDLEASTTRQAAGKRSRNDHGQCQGVMVDRGNHLLTIVWWWIWRQTNRYIQIPIQ